MGLGKRQLSADCETGRQGARLCVPAGVALDSCAGFCRGNGMARVEALVV